MRHLFFCCLTVQETDARVVPEPLGRALQDVTDQGGNRYLSVIISHQDVTDQGGNQYLSVIISHHICHLKGRSHIYDAKFGSVSDINPILSSNTSIDKINCMSIIFVYFVFICKSQEKEMSEGHFLRPSIQGPFYLFIHYEWKKNISK